MSNSAAACLYRTLKNPVKYLYEGGKKENVLHSGAGSQEAVLLCDGVTHFKGTASHFNPAAA